MTTFRKALIFGAAVAACLALRPTRVNTQLFSEQFNGHDVMPGEVLVRLRDAAQLPAIRQLIGAVDDRPVGSGTWRRIRSNSRTVQALIQLLAARGDVEAEPNYILQAVGLPNDPSLPSLWNLGGSPGIHATSAWDVTTGSAATVVGVVDSGIDYTHPDLAANVWSAPTQFTVMVAGHSITCPAGSHGFNAINMTCDPLDDLGHGTHVSGTIGAVGNNSVGVVGVNWKTRIMGLKFLSAAGSGSSSDAINALDFAIQTRAFFGGAGGAADVRVLSNSYGGGGFEQSFSDAIGRANTANMLFVAAAGNNASNNDATPFYPASYTGPNTLAVAASDGNDNRASFSSYGPTSVDLAAPGVSILSTTPSNTYNYLSGTSMATPHVSGAAALVLSACRLTTAQLLATLLNTVDPEPAFAGLTVTGGRVDVDNAVRSCATFPTTTLSSPTNGATYNAPASIALAANASDPDGIQKVDFYAGSNLIATSTSSPFGGTWANVQAGSYSVTAVATDTLGLASTSTPVSVTVTATSTGLNVALASNGGVATASSTYAGSGYAASGAINGSRLGLPWGGGGGWADGTANTWPDWLEVDFNGAKTISEVDVFSLPDNFASAPPVTQTTTFTQYGLTDFVVQYWDGAQWLPLPGGSVSNNALVWKQLTFAPVTTTKVRLWVTGVRGMWTCVPEIEVYGVPAASTVPPTVNIAAPAEGAMYTLPVSVTVTANANDSDGTVASVAFFANGNPIGADTTSAHSVVWPNVPAGSYTLTAVATDNLGATTTSAPVHITVNAPAGYANVALTSNGGVATASSTYAGSGYGASGAINGIRSGLPWGGGGGWADGTANTWPDWLEVDFNGAKTISEVDVFSLPDNFASAPPVTQTTTFTQYGLTDFVVQYWDGTQWMPLPGGSVSNNTLVWKQLTFAPVTTTKVRLWVTGVRGIWTCVPEIEVYGVASTGSTNVALASNGGVATASSTFAGSGYAASGAINGSRSGLPWGGGGGWADGTANTWPDWLEVDFNGAKTISEVDVFSLPDNFASAPPVTQTTTFTQYGLTDFVVQYWDGAQWAALPGGSVSNNALVWKQLTFAPVTTTKVRLWVTGARGLWTCVPEIEVY